MRLFFYGTLMDQEFLVRVLRRPVAARDLVPAQLSGWRRTAVKGKPYPIVLRQPGASVAGLIFDGASAVDVARLTAYEGAGYRLARGAAESGARRYAVRFFAARPGAYTPTYSEWDFAAWRRRRWVR